MKLNGNKIPLILFALASVLLLRPDSAVAQAATLTPPKTVSLEVLECSQTPKSQAVLSWEVQTGANEYRVYTRLGEDAFKDYVSTESAKIKIPLSSDAISIVAVSSVSKNTDQTGKTVTQESEKSPEFEVNVKKLCERITPTEAIPPLNLKNQPTEVKPSTTITPTEKVEPSVTDEVSVTPTPTETEVKNTDQTIEKLDKKYEESRKTQAKIEKQFKGLIKWIKQKIFFFN